MGILIASLSALAGVYRLARFNVQLAGFEDKLYFTGMPIPSGALTLFSYGIFIAPSGIIPPNLLIPITSLIIIIVSLGMISTVKFDNLPRPTIGSFKARPVIFILGLLAFAISVYSKGEYLFYVMALYILWGMIRGLILMIGDRVNGDQERDTLEDPDEHPFDI
jgi:CDP-diacylglycerol--serine O-phosphatidyltransferase